MKRMVLMVAALGLVLGGVGQARATSLLQGETINLEILWNGAVVHTSDLTIPASPAQATWLNFNGAGLVISVFDTGPNSASAVVTVTSTGTFQPSPNLLLFTDEGPNFPTITNVTLANASSDWNFPSRVSFSSNSFSYDLGSLNWAPEDTLTLQITGQPSTAAAPEPTTLTLAGLNALGLLGFAWWRKRKQPA